jgi:hypothetical protein
MQARRALRERGSAIVEFTWATLLLLVPFLYVLVAVFDAQSAAFAVSAASSAATRAYVQSPDPATAEDRARRAAELVLADHDVDGAHVTLRCEPACFVAGSHVYAAVEADQPLPMAPAILGDQLAVVHVDAVHAEPFGSYRQGA